VLSYITAYQTQQTHR